MGSSPQLGPLLYKIPRVVIGKNVNLLGAEEYLASNGVHLTVLQRERSRSDDKIYSAIRVTNCHQFPKYTS